MPSAILGRLAILSRVARRVCEKNRPNCTWKEEAQNIGLLFLIFKENNSPIGKNSPNSVTLICV
jgi:hypothetical protein